VSAEKQEIRLKMARKRTQAFDQDQATGCESASLLAQMIEVLVGSQKFSIVSGYIPIGTEIDPRPLMAKFLHLGAALCLPVVVQKGSPLQFQSWVPGDMLASGPFETLQPMACAKVVEPDFLLVPLLGVDGAGVRLGYGGGYYDRTLLDLKKKGARAFGVCYDVQLVEDLPKEEHDQLLDGVITPSLCIVWNEERQMRYLAQN